MSERHLATLPHFVMTIDEARKFLRLKRTKTPYASMDELRESNKERAKVAGPYVDKGYGLLLDARDGPLRNDPEFERETRQSRVDMVEKFSRAAILVATAIGALQLKRLNRTEGGSMPNVPVQIFENDEAGAIAFLTQR